ncbi:hypothetical protein Bbelb_407510 [Branchiostoma belcheri]|nr:hypothetical protein Bbelb_407510 [Branchiostoma belcheri]
MDRLSIARTAFARICKDSAGKTPTSRRRLLHQLTDPARRGAADIPDCTGHQAMPACQLRQQNNFGFPQVKYTHATGGNSNQDRSSVPTMLIVWQSLLTYSCFSCVNVVNGMETRSDFDQQCL